MSQLVTTMVSDLASPKPRSRSSRLIECALIAIALVLAACAPATSTGGAEPAACVVHDDVALPAVLIALPDRIDVTAAPIPTNAAERVLFRQLYETLVTVDCQGRVRPGLATAWTKEEAGRTWVFQLRPDVTFSDHTTVNAQAVLDSWTGNARSAAAAHALIERVTALSARELRVTLRSATAQPAMFAHPAFAIARRVDATTLPLGSGSYALASHDVARGIIRLQSRTGSRTIELHTLLGPDARRALDAGVDALITADPAARDYARALAGYRTSPLPWSRSYVLVTHTARAALTTPPEAALLELARDVVRSDARAAQPEGVCLPATNNSRTTTAPLRLVVYPRDDMTARALAERLVALSWPVTRTPEWLRALQPPATPVARGMEPRALVDALRNGEPHAYVLPLPRMNAGVCAEPNVLGHPFGAALSGSAVHITPLIDTREHLITRNGLGRVVVDDDGTIRFRDRSP